MTMLCWCKHWDSAATKEETGFKFKSCCRAFVTSKWPNDKSNGLWTAAMHRLVSAREPAAEQMWLVFVSLKWKIWFDFWKLTSHIFVATACVFFCWGFCCFWRGGGVSGYEAFVESLFGCFSWFYDQKKIFLFLFSLITTMSHAPVLSLPRLSLRPWSHPRRWISSIPFHAFRLMVSSEEEDHEYQGHFISASLNIYEASAGRRSAWNPSGDYYEPPGLTRDDQGWSGMTRVDQWWPG